MDDSEFLEVDALLERSRASAVASLDAIVDVEAGLAALMAGVRRRPTAGGAGSQPAEPV